VSSVRIVTTYAAVALGVIALLFIGIRPGAWGLLRFVLAVHLLGDVLFGWVWSLMPTYAFMKYIDDADRIYAALFLAAAVCATDVTYRLSRRVGRFIAGRFSLALRRPTTAEARPGFSSAFLVAGLACKLVFLGATGVLTGERGLSELRPSDSIGLGAIVMLADFLIPYGVAALRRAGRAPWPVVGDLILLAVLSFLSFSKAAFITYALIYGLSFLLAEGWTRTRREFLNWRSVLIVVIAVLSLGIKSQQRAGMLVSLSSSVMTEQTMSGASARFIAARSSGATARTVTILERQSRQMARLLDDLLEASRVTQNKIELHRHVIDVRLIATEAAEAVRSQMQDKGLEFVVDVEPAPLCVLGDAARLQQIQINLLSNAAKYTPRGGRVVLRVRREGQDAVIRVVDTGAGIPRHLLESVFDLFVQARHTIDHAEGGLGVGLTLVRALVELHGGSVRAHSDGDGTGSEFVVRLPLTMQTETARQNGVCAPSAPPAGMTVVVVEDNADSREVLCTMLSEAGLSVQSAADGVDALALIDRISPDVVILDVGLPGIDGLEVARRIRAGSKDRRIHLVALTGYGRASDRAATRDAGFDDHLVKPVEPAELFAVLARAQESAPDQSDAPTPAA